MIINNNIPALNTYRQMGANQGAAASSMEKLASGLRINRAGDDAAGLAISEKMRAQVRGLDQASRNSQDGISMIQTAEGALQETQNILQRMRELATQAANDTNVEVDREEIQKEINALTSEINRIGNTTEFNTQKLLDGGVDQAGGGAAATSFHQVAATASADTDFTGNAATITIGGASVTLDTDYTDLAGVIDHLNTGFEGTGITFSEDPANAGQLLISGAEGFTVEVTEADASAATLGFTDGTNSSEVNVEYTVEAAASADTDFTGNAATITIGGTSVTLDTDYTDLAGVIDHLNTGFEGTGITFSEDPANAGQLLISGAEGFTVEVTEADASAATLGFTDGSEASSNVPAGLELPTGGAAGEGFNATFQIGANMGQSMTINILDMRSVALGVSSTSTGAHADGTNPKATAVEGAAYTEIAGVTNGTDNGRVEFALDVSSHETATAAIKVINNAIEAVSAQRSDLGAFQNRLEHTISNLNNASENLQAAESRIRDVDMAREVMDMTKNNILAQASQAMLAQANQAPQAVLQLLG
ncbi:flagellin [Alkalihalophilus pseudofirmus]|uniref:Flagellin n=1 Tax=Alkalihalophilus pseudofirmus TaxID=79885 RepID=A0AAJ2NPN2_ALKPS|nr:flagellin [Alkalihalophilus pseudofirmus]MDV2886279.1 flagellin [Alkalihalophilus pseudofirmus]